MSDPKLYIPSTLLSFLQALLYAPYAHLLIHIECQCCQDRM
jgi:hypothetical protein